MVLTVPDWMKRITVFLISQNLSLFGSSVVGFAILWYITIETASGVWMMLWTICSLVPQVLISLFGGVWADRYNRKYLIMISDGFIALATLGVAVAFLLGFRSMELLLVASVMRSLGAGVQTPAVNAIYPQLVPEEKLTKVQGINQTLASGLTLLSPAVGGLVLGTAGLVGAFFVDISTAAVAVLVMSRIKVGRPVPDKEHESMLTDIRGGVSYIWQHAQLRRLIGFTLVAYLFATPAFTMSHLMIVRVFGGGVWRLTVNEIVWSSAMIAGGIFVTIKGQFRNKPRTIAICGIGLGVALGLLGVSWNFASYLVFMGLAGLFWPVFSTAQTVFVQETVPADILGRVFSVIQMITYGVIPLAILFFGPLADAVRIETILIVSSGLMALVAVVYGLIERRNTVNPSCS